MIVNEENGVSRARPPTNRPAVGELRWVRLESHVDDLPLSLDRRISAWCKASWSWTISAGVHAVATLLLMLCTTSPEYSEPVLIHFAEQQELDSDAVQPVNLEQASFAAVGSLAPARQTGKSAAYEAIDGLGPAVSPPDSGVDRAGEGGASGSRGPVETVRTLFKGGEKLFGEVGQESQGTRFFGIQATGKRFVFVVDSSSSMKWAKWRRACSELVASIESLGPDQSFCVFFFDAVPHLMFNQRPTELQMVPANSNNIIRLRRWMASVSFGDDTRPLAAVRQALALQPDAVFLLSDGEFHDPTLAYFRINDTRRTEGLLSRPIVVHTIGFKSQVGQATLREIADETGGTYRFVP